MRKKVTRGRRETDGPREDETARRDVGGEGERGPGGSKVKKPGGKGRAEAVAVSSPVRRLFRAPAPYRSLSVRFT